MKLEVYIWDSMIDETFWYIIKIHLRREKENKIFFELVFLIYNRNIDLNIK